MLKPEDLPERKRLFLLWCREKIPYVNREKAAGYTFSIVAVLTVITYLGGLLGQFIGNYHEYLQHGGLTGNSLIRLPNAHFPYCVNFAIGAPLCLSIRK